MMRIKIILLVCCVVFLKRVSSAPNWGGYVDDVKRDVWTEKQIPSTSYLLNWILQLLYRSDFYTLLNYNINSGVWNVRANPNKDTPSSTSDTKPEGLQTSNLDDNLVMVRDKENEQTPTTKIPPLSIVRDYGETKTTSAPSTVKLMHPDIPVIILTGNSAERIQDGSTTSHPALSTIRDYAGERAVDSTTKSSLPVIGIGQTSGVDTNSAQSNGQNLNSGHLQTSDLTSTPSLDVIRFTNEQTTKSTTPNLVVVRDKVDDETVAASNSQNSPNRDTTTTSSTTTSKKNSGLAILGPNDIMGMFG